MISIRILSIINLKGGVGKTISAVNMAYTLTRENFRVLLIDNDKQGNASKFYGTHDYDKPSISDVLTQQKVDLSNIIQHTEYERLDVIPANRRSCAPIKRCCLILHANNKPGCRRLENNKSFLRLRSHR